jgi:phenylalanyl-tRNA synthetase beta chain
MVGVLLFGTRTPESWHRDRAEVDYFDVKGLLEQIFDWSALADVDYAARRDPVMHPGQAATVLVAGEPVGRLGRLHPEIETRLDLPGPVYFFEVVADVLRQRGMRKYQAFSRYPSVRRDLALVVDQQVTAAAIERVVRETLGAILTDFRLFDVYHGKGIDSNEKSLAVGLTLQDPSATLTEDQIAGCTEAVLAALQRDVGARLR